MTSDVEQRAIEGTRLKIADDPSDPDFEILTFRSMKNSASGGPDAPRVDLVGREAHNRWSRLLVGRCAGFLADVDPTTSRKLIAIVKALP